MLNVGDSVTVTDEHGVEHMGLVTAVHGEKCINALYISNDPAKVDPYGRQVERLLSLSEKGNFTAPNGRFFEVL